MINLIDVVNCMVCESFSDPRMYQIYRSLEQKKLNFKRFYDQFGVCIAWDKVKKNDIEEVEKDGFDQLIKDLRRMNRVDSKILFVVFGMKKERVVGMIGGDLQYLQLFNDGKVNTYFVGRQGSNGMTYYNLSEEIKDWDYAIKVNVSDDLSVGQICRNRYQSKVGVMNMTDADHTSKHLTQGVLGKEAGGLKNPEWGSYYHQCKRMVDEAVKKWKEIIAENKYKKDKDSSLIDTAVQNMMKKVMESIPKLANKSGSMDFEQFMKEIYDKRHWVSNPRGAGYMSGVDGLLYLYDQYCQTTIRMNDETNAWTDKNQTLKERTELKKRILEKILVIDDKLNKMLQ